jgi:hypothetical protein
LYPTFSNAVSSNITTDNMNVVNNNLIVNGIPVVIGRYYFHTTVPASTTNTTTVYQTRVTQTQTFEAGTYMTRAYCEVASGTALRIAEVNLTLDGTSIAYNTHYLGITAVYEATCITSFDTYTAGSHTILLQFRRGASAATITIRNAAITIYRIA